VFTNAGTAPTFARQIIQLASATRPGSADSAAEGTTPDTAALLSGIPFRITRRILGLLLLVLCFATLGRFHFLPDEQQFSRLTAIGVVVTAYESAINCRNINC